jgi:hypothetical protein
MRSLKIYLIAGGIFLVLYIMAQVNRPQPINWTETLINTEKIPYGTYIAYNRLKDVFPGAKIVPYRQAVYNVIADDSLSNSSYIIIAPSVELDQPDLDAMQKYVSAGNDVFIAANYFGPLFVKKLKVSTAGEYGDSSTYNQDYFVSPYLDSGRYYKVGKHTGQGYFESFDTARTVVLGKDQMHMANYIKMKFGKGWLYLSANPLFFSNYSMLKHDGQQYAATALSFLKNTKQVAWDEYYSQGTDNDGSMMRVFLDHPTLSWAYYITLCALLLFLFFEIKRRQRIIPVVAPPENSTVSFVSTVGQVYFEQRNNQNIANKKILYFLEHLRVEYNLKTNPLDQEFIEAFSRKTAIEPDFAKDIVAHFNLISVQHHVTDQQLIELNNLIEKFHTKST